MLFHYVIDYNNYVSVLCENRDKPEMKCNGQCHLAKELKAIDEPTDAKGATPIPSQLQTELIFLPPIASVSLSAFSEQRSEWVAFDEKDILTAPVNVFVPPPEYTV